jgi:hypothetical protein
MEQPYVRLWLGWHRRLWLGSGRRLWLSNVAGGWKHGGSEGTQTQLEVGTQRRRGFVTDGRHRRDSQFTIFGKKRDDLLLHLGGPTPLGTSCCIATWPGHYGPTT